MLKLILLRSALDHAVWMEMNAPAMDAAGTANQINWRRLLCGAVSIFNLFAVAEGIPPLPTPPFCTSLTCPR